MNDSQLVVRLQRIAQSHRVRSVATNGLVWPLGSIIVSSGLTLDIFRRTRKPIMTVVPGGSQANDEFPELKTSSVSVVLATSVPGDKDGSRVLTGGIRSSMNTSDGMGLLQLQAELGLAADLLSQKQGVNLISVAESAAEVQLEQDVGFIGWREYIFSAETTTGYSDLPAEFLQASGTAPVVLTWREPFDPSGLIEYRVRRIAGEVPVVFPEDGDDVGTVAAGTETISDTPPGSGKFTYSVFAFYDARGGTYPMTYSDCPTVVVDIP